MKTIINTKEAPQPIGPYNQAVAAGGFLFISGQIAIDPNSGQLVTEDITTETHTVLKSLKAILAEAGLSFDHIVKTTIFLSDMNNFALVNEIYGSYFSGNFPARETVEVSVLPKNVNVEISAIAIKSS
ncbi:MAG: RidA family protein [Mucilaginibacter sp.]|uniref:RidA family protein n=1 Tax=Mucilaginibacter sp. TaxID=1882438 RepID=UPI0034E3A94B